MLISEHEALTRLQIMVHFAERPGKVTVSIELQYPGFSIDFFFPLQNLWQLIYPVPRGWIQGWKQNQYSIPVSCISSRAVFSHLESGTTDCTRPRATLNCYSVVCAAPQIHLPLVDLDRVQRESSDLWNNLWLLGSHRKHFTIFEII